MPEDRVQVPFRVAVQPSRETGRTLVLLVGDTHLIPWRLQLEMATLIRSQLRGALTITASEEFALGLDAGRRN